MMASEVHVQNEAVEILERAIKIADPNCLRMALYQITGDPRLAAMKVEKRNVRGGVFTTQALAQEERAELECIAREVITSLSGKESFAPSSRAETRELVSLFAGEQLSPNVLDFAVEELGLEDFPRGVSWQNAPPAKSIEHYHVVIVGAGICGLNIAVQLQRLGIPYTVIDRQADLGGTWEWNRYPDVRVDIPSFVYQYKFEKQYPWRHYYASGEENHQYLRHIADKYGISDHIRHGTHLVSGTWDDITPQWNLVLRDNDGAESSMTATVVITATGLFSTAKIPNIKGIRDFAGLCLHTTDWHGGIDYKGKRVAIVGNGSTGTQLAPALAASATELTLFQRTAQWIVPTENYKTPVPAELQWLMQNVPFYWNWHCLSQLMGTFQLQTFHYFDREWMAEGGIISRENDRLRAYLTAYINEKLAPKPGLAAKVTPTFPPLARRLVVDNGWYDALLRDNVELVTEQLERFTTRGILTTDGVEREFDIIVLATGFETQQYLNPANYRGHNGISPAEIWAKSGPRAYLGMTMPGLPNFFMLYGPNSQPRTIGHYSWAEIWASYLARLLVSMIENGHRVVECRPELFRKYNDELDNELKRIIWSEGKGGYHINKEGRSVIQAPWLVEDYRRLFTDSGPEDYLWS